MASHQLQPSDMLLLCSDGLTKMVEDPDIRDVLAKAQGDPVRACDALMTEALSRGGEDNVTVVVVARP
jgi:protein phosphatase